MGRDAAGAATAQPNEADFDDDAARIGAEAAPGHPRRYLAAALCNAGPSRPARADTPCGAPHPRGETLSR
jgi:hypothetical protein